MELLDARPDAPDVERLAGRVRLHLAGGAPRPGRHVAGLCTDLHAVNTALEAQGFGPGLLCSLVPFADATGRRVGLVYLYKQGTFYPFAPTGAGAATTCSSSRCATTSRASCRWRRTWAAGWPLWGAPGLLTRVTRSPRAA